MWEASDDRIYVIKHQTLQIAKLILHFNVEREMTAMYVTARTPSSQEEAKASLDLARLRCDQSLAELPVWPGWETNGDHMYRSPHLFAAILDRHRSKVKVGNYFWDEIQFYTDIIDILLGWLNRFIGDGSSAASGPHIWQLINSHGYLMGAISYLGAEQALCTVFHSIICFSHKETFYYANFSFTGEALFRLYRQSYPSAEDIMSSAGRTNDWRTAAHQTFFPELQSCRQEILADMDYAGTSTDPSLCSYSRKNETRFNEIEILTTQETEHLVDAILSSLRLELKERFFCLWMSTIVLVVCSVYTFIAHLVRCTCIICSNARKRRKRRQKLLKLQSNNQHQAATDSNCSVGVQGSGSLRIQHVCSYSDNRPNSNNCYCRPTNHKLSPDLFALKVASV